VGTLLDISSIESGKYNYKFMPTDMAALAASVAADLAPVAAGRGVTLFFEGVGEGQTLPPARADAERVKWILNNLVENGIRYTPTGGSVRIRMEMGGGRIFVKVKDTGIGIPAADRGNIFERFYRSGNAIAKENAGNGLGLYIARTIAKDHGGDLSFVPNEDGPGTTFILSLPLA
jgi:signal transduction histidine kinase